MDDPIGRRFVGIQAALFLLIAAGPWLPFGGSGSAEVVARALGVVLVLVGMLLAGAAVARLGRNLTPFPRPRAGGELVTQGVYRHVRHPIYGGVLLLACGWALVRLSPVAAVAVLLLWWLFERKSRYEERVLVVAYPGYAAYAARTRRFVPFLY